MASLQQATRDSLRLAHEALDSPKLDDLTFTELRKLILDAGLPCEECVERGVTEKQLLDALRARAQGVVFRAVFMTLGGYQNPRDLDSEIGR